MEPFALIAAYSDRFVPVFIRVMTMIIFIPFIGSRTTPIFVRVGLGLALTLLLLPVVTVNTAEPLKAVFEAVFVGLSMGLMVRLVLSAVEMAAQWISISMGLGVASVFNPQFGEILGPISTFYTLMTMGLFFIFDLHHIMIEAMVRSFDITAIRYEGVFNAVMKLNSFFFPLAFKIAAPIFLVQILVQLAVGFLSRAMPQANIFFVSFPLLIGTGIIFMALTTGLVFMIVSRSFVHMKDAIGIFAR